MSLLCVSPRVKKKITEPGSPEALRCPEHGADLHAMSLLSVLFTGSLFGSLGVHHLSQAMCSVMIVLCNFTSEVQSVALSFFPPLACSCLSLSLSLSLLQSLYFTAKPFSLSVLQFEPSITRKRSGEGGKEEIGHFWLLHVNQPDLPGGGRGI